MGVELSLAKEALGKMVLLVDKQKRKGSGFWFWVFVAYFLRIIIMAPTKTTTMMIAMAAPSMVHV